MTVISGAGPANIHTEFKKADERFLQPGGLFFTFGVFMFFDRAMLAMGNVSLRSTSLPLSLSSRQPTHMSVNKRESPLTQSGYRNPEKTDPLPSRHITPPRRAQDVAVFRPPAEMAGHGRVSGRSGPDLIAVPAHWVFGRGVRRVRVVWRVLHDYCGLRVRDPRRWTYACPRLDGCWPNCC